MTASVRAIALIIVVLIVLLTVAAMLVWLERRLLALWQDRYRPNRVGPFGLLQTLADTIKLLTKEDWIPPFADKPVFVIAPAVIMVTVLMAFAVVPFAPPMQIADLNIGLLFFLGMSSLGVYGVVMAGSSSPNKYALHRQRARRRTDARLRGLDGAVADGYDHTGRIVELGAHRRGAARTLVLHPANPRLCSCSRTRASQKPDGCPSTCLKRRERSSPATVRSTGVKFGMFFLGESIGIALISAMVVDAFFGGWLGPWLPPIVWFALKTFILICGFSSSTACRGRDSIN